MSLKEKLSAAANGKSILFVGAGGTLDCTNFKFQELPTVNPLLNKINGLLGKSITHLPTAASMLADKDLGEYLRLVTSTYTVLTVPQDLIELVKFSWQKIYTTNYDDAIETACKFAQIEHRTYVASDILDTNDPRRPIIHLHGFVERFTTENIRSDCVLDFGSNVANEVYSGYWGSQIKNDIANCDVCVFLGYSLYDPEIPKILKSIGMAKNKIFFVNSHQENEELSYRQREFGTPMHVSRDGLAKIALSATKQGKKSLRETFTCFDRPQADVLEKIIVGQESLESHFLYGNRDSRILANDAREILQNYVVRPKIVDDCIAALDTSSFVTIYSNLGYGKTVAARILLEIGQKELSRNTFLLRKDQPELITELDYICDNYEKPLLIIEDIVKFKRHWYKFAQKIKDNGSIVATSRFNIFESSQSEIEAAFIDLRPIHIRIEGFSAQERTSLVPLISQASLWGDNSSLSTALKANLIVGKFKNNFADLLIGLMSSRDLIGRYKSELALLKDLSPSVYEGVILCIYLEFIEVHPDELMLRDAFGKEVSELSKRADVSDLVRNFLLSDRNGVFYTSSIFSKFAIEKICDTDDLARAIEDALVRLVYGPSISGDLYHVARELMRFNYLKSLARDGNFDRIAEIYDHVSRLPALHEHDLFWLQFGMLERARKNYPKARRHFLESRGYARKRGPSYVPFQTENQLVACILEVGIYSSISVDEAFKDAVEVLELLDRQLDEARSSGSNQPFQWHPLIDQFLDKWMPVFSNEQRKFITIRVERYKAAIIKKIAGWERRTEARRTVDVIQKHLSINYPSSTPR